MTAVQPTEEVWRYGTRDFKGLSNLTAWLLFPILYWGLEGWRDGHHYSSRDLPLLAFYLVAVVGICLRWKNVRISVGSDAVTMTNMFGNSTTIKFSDIHVFGPDDYVWQKTYIISSASARIVIPQETPDLKGLVARIEQKRRELGNGREVKYGSWIMNWPSRMGKVPGAEAWKSPEQFTFIQFYIYFLVFQIITIIGTGPGAFNFWLSIAAIVSIYLFVRHLYNLMAHGYSADRNGIYRLNRLGVVSSALRYSEILGVQAVPPEPGNTFGTYNLQLKVGTVKVGGDPEARRLLNQIREGMEAAGHGDRFPAVPD